MDAEEQEALSLLIVAVVGVQHFADFPHHVTGVHGTGGLHAPGKAQGTGLGLFVFILLLGGHVATETHSGKFIFNGTRKPVCPTLAELTADSQHS